MSPVPESLARFSVHVPRIQPRGNAYASSAAAPYCELKERWKIRHHIRANGVIERNFAPRRRVSMPDEAFLPQAPLFSLRPSLSDWT
jgi:hypothetical protein